MTNILTYALKLGYALARILLVMNVKTKNFLMALFCSTIMLCSCSNAPRFSNGYQYDGYEKRDAIAYRTETDIYSYLQDIPITIGFGHYESYSSEICSEHFKVSLLLSAQSSLELEKTYLLEEITGDKYCSDSFLVKNDPFDGKTFTFERNYEIPSFLFQFLKENNSQNLDIVIADNYEGKSSSICSMSITFEFLSDDSIKFIY